MCERNERKWINLFANTAWSSSSGHMKAWVRLKVCHSRSKHRCMGQCRIRILKRRIVMVSMTIKRWRTVRSGQHHLKYIRNPRTNSLKLGYNNNLCAMRRLFPLKFITFRPGNRRLDKDLMYLKMRKSPKEAVSEERIQTAAVVVVSGLVNRAMATHKSCAINKCGRLDSRQGGVNPVSARWRGRSSLSLNWKALSL